MKTRCKRTLAILSFTLLVVPAFAEPSQTATAEEEDAVTHMMQNPGTRAMIMGQIAGNPDMRQQMMQMMCMRMMQAARSGDGNTMMHGNGSMMHGRGGMMTHGGGANDTPSDADSHNRH